MHTDFVPRRVSLVLLAAAASSVLPAPAQQALFDGVSQGVPAPPGGAFKTDQNILQWGPARVAIDVSYSLEYTDNVYLSSADRQWDLINTPQVDLGFYVPVTDMSSLQFTLGVGYSVYVEHSELNRFNLIPGSELSYTIPLDEVSITFFDSMSYDSNPLSESGLSGTGEFSAFQNNIGTRVTWTPDRYILTAGASYQNYFSTTSGQYSYLDSHGPNFIARAGYKITGKTQAGVEASAGLTRFDDPLRNDFNSYTFGPYVSWQLLEKFNISARAGYVYYDFVRASVGASGGTFSSYYGSITASQDLTDHISHSLSLSREFSPGVTSAASQIQQVSEITYSPQWRFIDAATLSLSGGFQEGNDGAVGIGDTYTRWIASVGIRYNVIGRLSTALTYQFYSKDSSLQIRDYKVNAITWSVNYSF